MANKSKWKWVSSTVQEAVVNGCVCTAGFSNGSWFASARVKGKTFQAVRASMAEAKRAAEMMAITGEEV